MCGERTMSMRRGSIDDELRALAEPPLHARGEDRVRIGRVRTDDDDDVAAFDRLEVLCASRGAEGLA